MSVRDARGGRWFWMHNAVLDHYGAELGPEGIAVYAFLARMVNEDSRCFPSVAGIAKAIGMSERTVQRRLRLMEELRLIEVDRRELDGGGYGTSVYTLLTVPDPGDRGTPPWCQRDTPLVSQRHHPGVSVTPPSFIQDLSNQDMLLPPPPSHACAREDVPPDPAPTAKRKLSQEEIRLEGLRVYHQHEEAIFSYLRTCATRGQTEELLRAFEYHVGRGRTVSAEQMAEAIREAQSWCGRERQGRPAVGALTTALAAVVDPLPIPPVGSELLPPARSAPAGPYPRGGGGRRRRETAEEMHARLSAGLARLHAEAAAEEGRKGGVVWQA